MHTVIETPTFEDGARTIDFRGDALDRVIDAIASSPSAGDPMPGLDGVRVRHFDRVESGMDADVEVVTFFSALDVPVFLLDVFFSGQRIVLARAQKTEMNSILSRIVEEYRSGVRAKIVSIRQGSDE